MKQLGTVFLIAFICLTLIFGATSCAEKAPPAPSGAEVPTPAKTRAEVNILESSLHFYPESFVFTHLIGEVQNTGNVPLRVTKITAEFYDNRGYLLDQYTTDAVREYLSPGEKSPFHFYWDQEKYPVGYKPHSMKIDYYTYDSPLLPAKIEVLNYHLALFNYYSPYIEVELHNPTNETIWDETLLVVFYDDQGKILSYGTAGTGTLLPNQVTKANVWPDVGLRKTTAYGPVFEVSENYSLVIY